MKRNVTLTITSLLAMLFFVFHWADDIVRGFAPGRVSGLGGVLILVIWLYGTLVLAERRSGHVIMLLGSLGALGVLALHMSGAGLVGGRIVNSSGIFFWDWTLHRARCDLDLLCHPLGARPVGPARGPVPIVQWQPETLRRGCAFNMGAARTKAGAPRHRIPNQPARIYVSGPR